MARACTGPKIQGGRECARIAGARFGRISSQRPLVFERRKDRRLRYQGRPGHLRAAGEITPVRACPAQPAEKVLSHSNGPPDTGWPSSFFPALCRPSDAMHMHFLSTAKSTADFSPFHRPDHFCTLSTGFCTVVHTPVPAPIFIFHSHNAERGKICAASVRNAPFTTNEAEKFQKERCIFIFSSPASLSCAVSKNEI